MTERRADRPNILLIMTDQQRSDTIHAAGNALIQTPQLDRLCAEGVRFDAAYSEAPVCVAARAVVMMGMLPHRTGVFDNGYRLDPTTPTLMRRLGEVGYVTQAIGKMHFAPVRQSYGFDRLWLSEEIPRRMADDEFLQDLHAAGYRHVEEPHGVRHELYYVPQPSQLPEHLHTTAWTARRTIQFLEERRGGTEPFFCWTSFIKPHPPFDPPAPWYHLYYPTDLPLPVRDRAEIAWQTYYHRAQNRSKWMDRFPDDNFLRTMKAYYYACISFIDSQVGLILDALERLGMRENTLIAFVSDHGEYLGDHYAFGKRGFHEPAAHIPFILSWPRRLPGGAIRRQLVGLADLAPTFLTAAGLDRDGLDGLDLLPAAQDEGRPTRSCLLGQVFERERGLYLAMDARWKYVYSAPDEREILLRYDREPELHDYAADPSCQETLRRLRQALIERFRRDGYDDPLDGESWRRGTRLIAPWESREESAHVEAVGRGWQYAAWTKNAAPLDRPAHHARYRFVTEPPNREVESR